MVEITVQDGRLRVRAPFQLVDVCRALPDRRWNADARAWELPATPESARAAQEAFGEWRGGLSLDDAARGLLGALTGGERPRDGADIDIPESLPELPGAYRHQLEAFVRFCERDHAGLAFGMGGGKSRVAVALLERWGAAKVLVITTNNGRLIWPEQFRRWGRDDWAVCNHGGMGRKGTPRANPSVPQRIEAAERYRGLARLQGVPVAIVVHWPLLATRMREWLLACEWDAVVFDESHHAKKAGGVWSRAAWALARRTPKVACLTGTLMPNSKIDAFAQTRLLDPSIFGTSLAAHRARYAVMGGFEGREIVGWREPEEHAARLARAWHVATEADMDLGLPPTTHITRECELSSAAVRAYQQMREEMVAQIAGGIITAANGLARLLRLAQLTGGFLPILIPCKECEGQLGYCPACQGTGELNAGEREVDDAKRELLAEVLEEIDPHEPVVVFARFRSHLRVIENVAAKLGRTYGEVSGAGSCLTDRGTIPAGVRVLGVQIQAGSEAVDFTAARYCVFYSTGFDNGRYQQALKRCHRPGQERHTTYVHLLARVDGAQSVDHYELEALERKEDAAAAVLDAMKHG